MQHLKVRRVVGKFCVRCTFVLIPFARKLWKSRLVTLHSHNANLKRFQEQNTTWKSHSAENGRQLTGLGLWPLSVQAALCQSSLKFFQEWVCLCPNVCAMQHVLFPTLRVVQDPWCQNNFAPACPPIWRAWCQVRKPCRWKCLTSALCLFGIRFQVFDVVIRVFLYLPLIYRCRAHMVQ